jgi:hypothetical protein
VPATTSCQSLDPMAVYMAWYMATQLLKQPVPQCQQLLVLGCRCGLGCSSAAGSATQLSESDREESSSGRCWPVSRAGYCCRNVCIAISTVHSKSVRPSVAPGLSGCICGGIQSTNCCRLPIRLCAGTSCNT